MNAAHLKIALQGTPTIREWRIKNPTHYLGLADANLTGADLADANLAGADLARAELTGANLTGANLTGAELTRANLTGANLTGAELTGAELAGADLAGAELGDVQIWQFGPCGSRGDYLVVKEGPNIDEVHTGCFWGTLTQFEVAVTKTHENNRFGREYQAIIACIKTLMAERA